MAEAGFEPPARDAEEIQEPSKLGSSELFLVLKSWFESDRSHSSSWRAEARRDFDFVALKQWDDKDRRRLEEQGRPVITFDRVGPILASVCGLEINSRHDTIFIPRTSQPGVIETNEVLSAASKWMADCCDANDEQSEAFEDSCIAGMGWTEQGIDHTEQWNGLYREEKVDPLEMYWDRAARKKNLTDARRMARVKKMTLAEAKDFLKENGIDAEDEDIDAKWAVNPDNETQEPIPVEEKRFRDENSEQFDASSEVHLVHFQWMEKETYFKVAVPQPSAQPNLEQVQPNLAQVGGATSIKLVDMSPTQHKVTQNLARLRGTSLKSVPLQRRVYKQAFLGASGILGEVKPTLSRCGFTYKCITGRRDRNKGTWFGLIRALRDPQMWANKWLAQSLHILNTTAKGGVVAEKGVFADIREAQETWAQPDAITEVEEGKLAFIMPKPGQGLPAGYQNLLEFAITSIRDVSGINVEMLGMRDANQPGVLEYQRKQAAMTILAPTFDALRRFRKEVGRNRLCFIQDYFSDGRLIRISELGADGQKVTRSMQLLKDYTIGDYEVIIDDAPTSPNQKEQTWAILQQLMQYLAPFLQNPQVLLTLLEYSPLPSELVGKLRELAVQSQQQQAPIEQQKESRQDELVVATIQRTQAQTRKEDAMADVHHTRTTLDILDKTGAFKPKVPVRGEYRGKAA